MTTLAESRKWEKLFWPVLVSALLLALWHYSVVWTATKAFPLRSMWKGIGWARP